MVRWRMAGRRSSCGDQIMVLRNALSKMLLGLMLTERSGEKGRPAVDVSQATSGRRAGAGEAEREARAAACSARGEGERRAERQRLGWS